MKKWEYRSIQNTPQKMVLFSDAHINKLGEQGWEMCGTLCSDEYNKQIIYFKREIMDG